MKKYNSPIISDMDITSESVYAGSGSHNNKDDSGSSDNPPQQGGDIEYTIEEKGWTSHNSGSHSEGQLYIHYSGKGGKYSRVSINYETNFDITNIWGYQPSEVLMTSSRTFTLSRSNTCPFNSGEDLELKFGVESNVEDFKGQNNAVGAVGVSSDPNGSKYHYTRLGQPIFS